MNNFLDNLPINSDLKDKLLSLAAPTPLAILCLRNAAPSAFDEYIGHENSIGLVLQLQTLLSEEDKIFLQTASVPNYSLGAKLI